MTNELHAVMADASFHVAHRLSAWRSLMGRKTQAELANDLGVDPSTVSAYEGGSHSPRGATAAAIERMTGIPASHWYAEKGTA